MPDNIDMGDLSGDLLKNVSVEVRICVGSARPTVSELVNLSPDSVLSMDRMINDPVELFIGEKLIGTGHLEEVEDGKAGQLAVRLTSVGDPVSGLS